jgi:hypothetical protein
MNADATSSIDGRSEEGATDATDQVNAQQPGPSPPLGDQVVSGGSRIRSDAMKARAYRWATTAAMLAVFLEAAGAGKKW